ncbi:AAA family ATPase [Leptospira kmetyi]|uniref:AAA+ ATPase domain-containing protein n=1 Tax=Leptospira kmetyi TaxID=408139 RepID=A0ABX4N8H6_9LEPT|nr:AAA family ATPase [Leptospira kmetyi]PJZ28392.1 hypothetical protein CH378_18115 [Leptospira kmetyi]
MDSERAKSLDKLLIGIVADGLRNDIESLIMRSRRFSSAIKEENPSLAKSITSLLGNYNVTRSASQNPLPVDSDTRQNLLIKTFPVVLEEVPIWNEEIKSKLNRFILERTKAPELERAGFKAARSILIVGPPGVGKTLSAKWIASELNLPLLTLDLATVMSSYLGKTGSNIRSVLNYAKMSPNVLLMDEFDAIAKKRNDDADVGELKRLVTVLLQAIDEWPSSSILIAATNHGELLDRAIWRRFDLTIEFSNPNISLIKEFLIQKEVPDSLAEVLSKSIKEESFSNIDKKIIQAKKNTLLGNQNIIEAIFDEFHMQEVDFKGESKLLRNFRILKYYKEGISQRKISDKLNVSRVVVKNVLSNFNQEEG